jgi:methionyl-tRNA synthetase
LLRARERNPDVIYKARYEGRYCVHDERYISDGAEPANCDICGRPAELVSEENYFFRLSAFKERLLAYYDDNPDFVRPDFRFNEVRSFVRGELRDISISRKRIKWGVPWPDDPEQVFYVWYDALTGYLTGIGFAEGKEGSAEFKKFWPADVHMVGKDIIRFHAVYWPAFLMAAELPLPRSIVAHGWLLAGQDKMSKSKGNVVYPEPLSEMFEAGTNGVMRGSDVLRYFVLRDIPFGQDATISYEALIQRYNSDLANDLGNLSSRTVTMLHRYFGGEVPRASSDAGLAAMAGKTLQAFRERWEAFDFSRGLDAVWAFIGRVNKYLVEKQPWALADADLEGNRAKLAEILYSAAEAVRFSTVLLVPVLPRSMERLWRQLGQQTDLAAQRLDALKWGGLAAGTRLPKPESVFPRMEKEATLRKVNEESAVKTARKEKGIPVETTTPAGTSPQPDQRISIDDFAKVDMRVGEIVSAEPVPGAQKLLKLKVDIGTEVRQVVAGIAEHYKPEAIVGMKVVLVTNLQPRKLRGVESNGMIVAASVGEEGRPVLVTFKEDVPKGAKLR